MPPKKTGTATAAPKKSSSSSVPAHASYQDMIKDAIRNLKDRSGSSRQAIKKYIQANNSLGNTTDAAFNTHINRALSNGEKQGAFARPKGPSGPVKLAKPTEKAAAKPAPKSVAKKPAPKKVAETKKPAPKKATSSTTKAKAAPKKATTTKSTANASKARKDAPAVVDKAPVVLGKTKSGRVTKSKAPAAAEKKKAAPTKKAPAKKAAPKKASASSA